MKVTVNAEKLRSIVELLSEVRLMLDGGWHYSSPIVRMRANQPYVKTDAQGVLEEIVLEPCGVVIERPDALSIVAELVSDLDRTSAMLSCLDERAKELGVDTRLMVGADLTLLTRVYAQLTQDISRAANDAVDALKDAPPPRAERKRRVTAMAATPAQTVLPNTTTTEIETT